MHRNRKVQRIQQRRIADHCQQTDTYDFFNVLTSDDLLSFIESVLPDHRNQ